MKRLLAFIGVVWLAGCAAMGGGAPPMGSDRAVGIAWQALDPYSASHQLSNWQVVEARAVSGADIREQFKNDVSTYCTGPKIEHNQPIADAAQYWYVHLKPRDVTPLPVATENYSPTAPPAIPEPSLRDASFLIDPASGQVVARSVSCVVY